LKSFVKTKTIVHQCRVLDISSVFPMKIPQDADVGLDIVFLLPKACRTVPRCDVNRYKSDVMTSFGLIDRSAAFCVIMRAGFSFTLQSDMLWCERNNGDTRTCIFTEKGHISGERHSFQRSFPHVGDTMTHAQHNYVNATRSTMLDGAASLTALVKGRVFPIKS
jgi:hypothetical protein